MVGGLLAIGFPKKLGCLGFRLDGSVKLRGLFGPKAQHL